MTGTYDDYLTRFSTSRNGRAVGRYTVSHGILVPLLSRREFAQRCRELDEKMLMHGHLRRRDYTVPFALERSIEELWAQLLLPGDHHVASVRRRLVA